ncbi:MAG: hypothetical protein ACLTBV_27695 [Enterocloster bolteae]
MGEILQASPGQSVTGRRHGPDRFRWNGLEEERDALSLEYEKAELALKQEQMSAMPRSRR